MKSALLITFFLSITLFSQLKAQSFCIEFTKQGAKDIIIKENQKISFALSNDTIEHKGELKKITKDTLFIERNKIINGYSVNDFKMFAYIQASSVIATVTYFVAMGFISAISGNQSIQALPAADAISPVKFREKINLNEGWQAKIIHCKKTEK